MPSSTSYQNLTCQPAFMTKQSFSIALLLVSALSYSLMGVFIQLATKPASSHRHQHNDDDHDDYDNNDDGAPSSMELVWFRTIIQGAAVLFAMMFFRLDENGEGTSSNAATTTTARRTVLQEPFGAPPVRLLVILRGMIGGLGLTFYYYTISVLPLGDATSLLSLNPIVTVLASSVLLGEGLNANVWAALSSAVGSALLARPTFLFWGAPTDGAAAPPPHQWLGCATAISGTCCAAAVYILIRKAGETGVHTLQLLWSWCCFGFLYGTTAMIFEGDWSSFPPRTFKLWIYILCSTLFGGSGHFFMNYAGRHAPAGLTAIIRSSGILWAYLWEVTVFGQIPKPSTLLGAGLICTSLILVAVQRNDENQGEDLREKMELADTEATGLVPKP